MNRFGRTLAVASAILLWAPCVLAQRGRPPPGGDDPSRPGRPESHEITIAIGESRTIPATDVANYSEATPGIIDVKLSSDSSQFVVSGLKAGTTTLTLIRKDGSQLNLSFTVVPRSQKSVENELNDLIDGYTGVRVRRVGARFFIEGGVNTEADVQRIKQIAALYPGQVESLVALGSGGIARNTNVRLDVFFVQYKRTSSYMVGIDYPGEIGGAAVSQDVFGLDFVAHTTSANAYIVNQPLPGLDIASQKNWAKVLKQTTIITTNGVEATFSNGGEQNFPVSAGLTGTIQKIQFGTTVTVLPRYDPDTGDLEVKVDADVADLTPPASNTPLPARDTAKLQTIVHMKLGQSLVLSGIRTRSKSHSIAGLPLLSEIPVFGVFFGSHGEQSEDREGAIFLVPSIVESVGRPPYDMIREALKQYNDYDGDLRTVKSYDPMPPSSVPTPHTR